MGVMEILSGQLTDLFRIGLLVALVVTTANTAAVTGNYLPLLLGAAFVAVLIPTTLRADSPDKMTEVLVGLVSNAIIVGAILAAKAIYQRLSQR